MRFRRRELSNWHFENGVELPAIAGSFVQGFLARRNLADDLQAWLAQGVVPPEMLAQVPRELREIAEALETGAPESAMPAIPGRPARRATRRRGKGIGSASPTTRSPFEPTRLVSVLTVYSWLFSSTRWQINRRHTP